MWFLADGNAAIVKRSAALLNYNDELTYIESNVYPNFIAGYIYLKYQILRANVYMGLII
jgi:hypothetical protein